MIKVEIKMNIDRIKAEGKYEPEFVLKAIDDVHLNFGFRKEVLEDGAICYWGKNSRNDFAHFALTIWELEKKEWFAPYVDRWLWFNNDDLPIEGYFRREDILEEYLDRKSA